MSRISLRMCSVFAFILLANGAALGVERGRYAGMRSPEDTLRAFYAFNLSHRLRPARQTLEQRRPWLTAELYELLRYEADREARGDEPRYIMGDAFADSQDTPSRFRVGNGRQSRDLADVPVTLTWLEGKRIVEERTCHVKLRQMGSSWKITDVIGDGGESLAAALKQLERADATAGTGRVVR